MYRTPSAAHLRERFHPLVSFAPPPEYSTSLRPRLATRAPSMGLRSLFAVSLATTASRDSGSRPSSVLGVSRALDVFYFAKLAGLFRPAAAYRVHLQGFSLSHSQGCLVDIPCPLVVERRSAATGCPAAPRRGASPSGLCSMRESVIPTAGFNRRRDPIPSWFSASSRCSVAETERRLHVS